MKRLVAVCLLVFAVVANAAVVQDNFNNYSNGPLIGQSAWENYYNGNNFVVQNNSSAEGNRALFYDYIEYGIIGRQGNLQLQGTQSFWVMAQRNGSSANIVEMRVNKTLWSSPALGNYLDPWLSVSLTGDGRITYYDQNYFTFSTYNDNEWNLIEMEWWISPNDRQRGFARYRANNGDWTDMKNFYLSSGFHGFDYVGICVYGNSGGVYVDSLGDITIPEPSVMSLLLVASSIFLVFFFKKKNK